MLERQPPIGGVGPPPPRGQGDVFSYHNKYLGAPAVPQDLHRSPRLMITPSSPDNVGPALGRLGRSIGISSNISIQYCMWIFSQDFTDILLLYFYFKFFFIISQL